MGHVEDRWKRAGRKGSGRRWRARYLDPDGRERSRSFDRKIDAERFLSEVEHSVLQGSYRDPDAGRISLRKYALTVFVPAQGTDPVTRERAASALNVHILPGLGDKQLHALAAHPSLVQAWASSLPLAPSSAARVMTILNAILRWAMRDGLITSNPCADVKLAKRTRRRIEPWPPEFTAAVRAGLPECFRAMTDAGTGLGFRQGELFAMSTENTDWLRRVVAVRVQVKLIGGRLYFAPPKAGSERTVPLAAQTAKALARHLELFPAAAVTLPWHEPRERSRHGKPHTLHLLFTGTDGGALHRTAFNSHVWRPARQAAGLAGDRVNGMHMLRHVYASTLISRGVDVRTVAEYLGHSDGGALVLSTYSHLMPDAEDRARRAIEDALAQDHGPDTALGTGERL